MMRYSAILSYRLLLTVRSSSDMALRRLERGGFGAVQPQRISSPYTRAAGLSHLDVPGMFIPTIRINTEITSGSSPFTSTATGWGVT